MPHDVSYIANALNNQLEHLQPLKQTEGPCVEICRTHDSRDEKAKKKGQGFSKCQIPLQKSNNNNKLQKASTNAPYRQQGSGSSSPYWFLHSPHVDMIAIFKPERWAIKATSIYQDNYIIRESCPAHDPPSNLWRRLDAWKCSLKVIIVEKLPAIVKIKTTICQPPHLNLNLCCSPILLNIYKDWYLCASSTVSNLMFTSSLLGVGYTAPCLPLHSHPVSGWVKTRGSWSTLHSSVKYN